ncbi:MAG: DNA-processing protein DprA [Muribaculaceae bacterium]|nr:DNA-processing protein DprA [Muribaculaceae bacterium]
MAADEMVFKMAFSFLKGKLTADLLREFESRGVTPEEFFTLPTKELVNRLGIPQNHDFDKMAREEALTLARNEAALIKNHNITPLFVLDEDYPPQLAETPDPPLILYKLGEAPLDLDYMVAVVGTRKPTPYGLDFCNRIVDEIGDYFPDVEIISGLAYGVDAAAHRKALEKNLKTVAVVAHGLNMIYPAANRNLAKEIIRSGGAILSEYPFGVQPFKPNFLARNRIVAGLSDVTIVVESNIKGGAMSTANYAFLYNRDVMALPGRSIDDLSSGCNLLIRKNKAHLVTCAADLIEVTGWQPLNLPLDTSGRNLFPELTGDNKKIYDTLKYSSEPMQIDQLVHLTGIVASKLLALLSELEFDGIIMRYPGNRYSLA